MKKNKITLGIILVLLNIMSWVIVGMLVWKNIRVDRFIYSDETYSI